MANWTRFGEDSLRLRGVDDDGVMSVALQAMLTAVANFDHHFSGVVATLAAFEAGTFDSGGFVPGEAVLDQPGAADNLADAFRRGEQCTGDITGIDFLLRRDDRLVDVRAEHNIEAVIPGR